MLSISHNHIVYSQSVGFPPVFVIYITTVSKGETNVSQHEPAYFFRFLQHSQIDEYKTCDQLKDCSTSFVCTFEKLKTEGTGENRDERLALSVSAY